MGKPVKPLAVGIIGCGKIVDAYLSTFARLDTVTLVAVADLIHERAVEVAARSAGTQALTIDELLAHPNIQLVINLTIPAAHADVAEKIFAAGKEAYGEKPLAATVPDAAHMLSLAEKTGLWLGCAPDTVLGTGVQTARQTIDDGRIGQPIAATATMVTPGHERWHPNPDFYYQPGGGPLLDMGPYYVSALVHLLGPITSVIGASNRMRHERTIGSGPRAGQTVPVDIDTHVTGVLRHASGALSTLVMSFDAVDTRSANIEVHGAQGTLVVPDPNHFDGDVQLRTLDSTEWTTLEPSAGYQDAGRGVGVHDRAITGDPAAARASGTLAFHVLEVMQAMLDSASTGTAITVTSTCERPAIVPLAPMGAAH
ncbi:Gfo/Idh/MocA family protein [Microbacterium sp. YY-01]|uniref:Gfo/Idh/MocA family protein n=1 Tax=Microbacterium sp. YY-01 TaxID=3421634 RepID=UPI003D165209